MIHFEIIVFALLKTFRKTIEALLDNKDDIINDLFVKTLQNSNY